MTICNGNNISPPNAGNSTWRVSRGHLITPITGNEFVNYIDQPYIVRHIIVEHLMNSLTLSMKNSNYSSICLLINVKLV